MASFKNVSGVPVDLPGLDIRVPVDGSFEVDAAEVAGLSSNPAFELSVPAPAAVKKGNN
jgi:hypothetical protein